MWTGEMSKQLRVPTVLAKERVQIPEPTSSISQPFLITVPMDSKSCSDLYGHTNACTHTTTHTERDTYTNKN